MIEILTMKYKEKKIRKELGCEFIRINPDEQNVDIFKAINKIHRHIKKITKKIFSRQDFKTIIRNRV